MRKVVIIFAVVPLLLLLFWAVLPMNNVYSHETRETEKLEFTIGFRDEPAYENRLNAVYVAIKSKDTVNTAQHGHQSSSASFTHGEILNQPIMPNQSVRYIVPNKAIGVSIPYHAHGITPEPKGLLQFLDHDTTDIKSVTVAIGVNGFSPNDLKISAGSLIIFQNATDTNILLMNDASVGDTVDHSMSHQVASDVPKSVALQAEVAYVATGSTKVLQLEPTATQGEYLAEFIPTAPGTYSFRIFGSVDGTQVDETFTGGSGTFDDVISQKDIQFPVQLASQREIDDAAKGAYDLVYSSQGIAASNRTLIWIAMTFGLFSLVISGAFIVGILLRRTSKK